MNANGYEIREAAPAEIQLMTDWAADEGWNPGLHDAAAFAAPDPGGFLVGTLEGEPVASISVVAYDEGVGFLGFYIVKPDHRGAGLGYRLWQYGMERMGSRNVGLDGVVAQQDNYRNSGFSFAWNNIRYRGRGSGQTPSGLTPALAIPFDELLAYDTAHFGCARPSFLQHWIAPPAGLALAMIETGTVAGYGVIRACREGYKIGPLFAETPKSAEELFLGLTASVPGELVYLDIPEPNAEARALVKRFGMEPVFETARMYTRGDPLHTDLLGFWNHKLRAGLAGGRSGEKDRMTRMSELTEELGALVLSRIDRLAEVSESLDCIGTLTWLVEPAGDFYASRTRGLQCEN